MAVTSNPPSAAWLLLVYHLPAKQSPARVKAWRRMQQVGALPLKNSAYVLPDTPEAREDFEWIKTEITAIGGQASVLAATTLDSASNDEIIAAFRSARRQDFDALKKQSEALLIRWQKQSGRRSALRPLVQSMRRLRERFAQIDTIDYFDAPNRNEAAKVLDDLDRHVKGARPMRPADSLPPGTAARKDYRKRVWQTRPRPGIDRMASAWLIQRFIDPDAKFTFGDKLPKSGRPVVPFDMFGADFGHHGGFCTFETLAQRFGITEPSVGWLSQIVHDLDLKEKVHRVPETAAVGRMVEGLRQIYSDDDQTLLGQGIVMIESLHRSFARGDPGTKRATSRSRQPRT